MGVRPRGRILLEAATHSEWVAQHFESFGHEVIVADPNRAAMYAMGSRRVNTDRRAGSTGLVATIVRDAPAATTGQCGEALLGSCRSSKSAKPLVCSLTD